MRHYQYLHSNQLMFIMSPQTVLIHPKTYFSPVSTQTVNTNRQQPTNLSPLRELNLQTNQAKSQITITSKKRLPLDENDFVSKFELFNLNNFVNGSLKTWTLAYKRRIFFSFLLLNCRIDTEYNLVFDSLLQNFVQP
ncbi:hypothetical protein BpHYR1_000281 [Brachionus plicatilis]|uniref:Uncharacterized protein n=1 Tax=Brachionus plicatilis TaxID=10195 RepID=A0A3M7TB10_BRAPC|nr:hypothetical protein BpHYR1_000281 [Brachionus plicatilis]